MQVGWNVGMSETREGAPISLRHQRMKRRKARHMHLVKNRARPGDLGFSRNAPRESGIDHPALLHRRRAIPAVEGEVFVGMIELIAEQFRPPS